MYVVTVVIETWETEKKKTVDGLLKLAKTHPSIWIATDEDRE
jgi:DNA topoisomerase IA